MIEAQGWRDAYPHKFDVTIAVPVLVHRFADLPTAHVEDKVIQECVFDLLIESKRDTV
jgi:hypothetical protein